MIAETVVAARMAQPADGDQHGRGAGRGADARHVHGKRSLHGGVRDPHGADT